MRRLRILALCTLIGLGGCRAVGKFTGYVIQGMVEAAADGSCD